MVRNKAAPKAAKTKNKKPEADSLEGRAIKAGSKLARVEVDFLEASLLAVATEQVALAEPDPLTRGLARKALEAFQTLGGRKTDLKDLEAEEPEQAKLPEKKQA